MSWIAVGIGAAVGVAGGAIYGSQKGGDAVWKDALIGGAVGSLGGAGAEALGGAGTAIGSSFGSAAPDVAAPLVTDASSAAVETTAPSIMGDTSIASAFGPQSLSAGAGTSNILSPTYGLTQSLTDTGGITGGQGLSGLATSYGVPADAVGSTSAISTPIADTASQNMAADTATNVADKAAQNPSWWSSLSPNQKMLAVGAGTVGLGALINQNNKQYGTPGMQPYSGALSKFHYNPSTFTPNTVTPNVYQAQYADGGITQLSPDQSMMASGSGNVDFMSPSAYPMSQQERTYFNTPSQMPTSAQQAMASYEPQTNPLTGEPTANMAQGGIASLGGYSDGGQLLRGPGDGVSDSIPASIGHKQPARLADGEFVVPARIVSELGNGSTEAGARELYKMMDRVQASRKKSIGKGKVAVNSRASKNLPA